MIKGIISQRLNKHPGLVGYDVIHKGNKTHRVEDYHLLFKGNTADINTPKATGVLENIDSTYDTVMKDKIATKEAIEKLEQEDDFKIISEINGQFIKYIGKKKGELGAQLRLEHADEEKGKIVNLLLDLYSDAVIARKDVGMMVTKEMRVGTLDIYVKDGVRTLVQHTKDIQEATGEPHVNVDMGRLIDPKQIKASLFFLLKLHEQLPEFQKHLNCSVRRGYYEVKFVQGKPEFIKHDSAPSEFEIGVCNDIKKLKW